MTVTRGVPAGRVDAAPAVHTPENVVKMRIPVPVTIRDVAQAAGVSTATASRALSGRRRVSPEIAQAVREASDRLGYRANVVARSLRMRSTNTVGMVLPGISNPFFPLIVEVIEPQLSAAGRQLLLCDSQGDVEVEAARVAALLDHQVDGILLVPCDSVRSADALLDAARHVPVVQIDRFVDEVGGDYVGVDNEAGIAAVVRHLRATGCERLAFVSANGSDSSARRRLQAYERATESLPGPPSVLLGEFTLAWGRRAAERILAARPLPDAIVCGADIVALGVVAALTAAGVRVPADVSVTGFDDIGFAAICTPPLTTVRQPADEIGTEGVQLLQRRLDGGDGRPQRRVLQPELTIRASTRG